MSQKLEKALSDDLDTLIQEFKPLFSGKPGSTNLIEHTINLTSDVPVRSKPYSVPYAVASWEHGVFGGAKGQNFPIKRHFSDKV